MQGHHLLHYTLLSSMAALDVQLATAGVRPGGGLPVGQYEEVEVLMQVGGLCAEAMLRMACVLRQCYAWEATGGESTSCVPLATQAAHFGS